MHVEKARTEDIVSFAAFEQQEDTKGYIIPYAVNEHLKRMSDPCIFRPIMNTQSALS
jgi:hypothetical protein